MTPARCQKCRLVRKTAPAVPLLRQNAGEATASVPPGNRFDVGNSRVLITGLEYWGRGDAFAAVPPILSHEYGVKFMLNSNIALNVTPDGMPVVVALMLLGLLAVAVWDAMRFPGEPWFR